MSDGVTLVFPERNFRVHTDKVDVGTIVFARSVAVEQFVVLLHQCNAPLGVLPDPVGESIFDYLLFLLRQHGVRFVQDALRSAFFIFNGIIDAHIFQVERIFQNLVGIGAGCAIGFGGGNVASAHRRLALNAPFCGIGRISHFNCMTQIVGNLESFCHKLLDDLRRKPCCTQPHINFRRFKVFRLRLFQCGDVDCKLRVGFSSKLCYAQFCPDIAGQVFIRHLPARFRVGGVCAGVFEDYAGQFTGNALIVTGSTEQLCHIGQVHPAMFSDGNCQSFRGRVHVGDGVFRADGAFREHCRFGFELTLLIQIFQRTQQIVRGILLK